MREITVVMIIFWMVLVSSILWAVGYKTANAQEFYSELPEPDCRPHGELETLFYNDYGEVMKEETVDENGVITQLWTNPTTGTFSVLVIPNDGTSCGTVVGRLEKLITEGL